LEIAGKPKVKTIHRKFDEKERKAEEQHSWYLNGINE
jgi:hypothetical protein